MLESKNTIYREMVMDLLHRLHLADEKFCQVTDMALAAMGAEVVRGRKDTVEQLNVYAQSLQIIYADFLHLIDGLHVTFPASVSLWQWYESDGDELVAQTLERLHAIAEGMQMRLNAEMVKMEVGR